MKTLSGSTERWKGGEEKVDQVGNECVEGDGKDEVGVGFVMDCMVSGAFFRCCPFYLLKLPQGTKTW